MSHTAGPWTAKPGVGGVSSWVVWAGDCGVADCFGLYEDKGPERWLTAQENEANARLIAAAPEMLAALEAVANLDLVSTESGVADGYVRDKVEIKNIGQYEAAAELVDLALSKAKGGA